MHCLNHLALFLFLTAVRGPLYNKLLTSQPQAGKTSRDICIQQRNIFCIPCCQWPHQQQLLLQERLRATSSPERTHTRRDALLGTWAQTLSGEWFEGSVSPALGREHPLLQYPHMGWVVRTGPSISWTSTTSDTAAPAPLLVGPPPEAPFPCTTQPAQNPKCKA